MGKDLVRLKGFQKLTPVNEALRIFLGAINFVKPTNVIISIQSALNRVLAEDIIAKEDLPRFDRSAVDGYAVKAEDTFEVNQFKPKKLTLTENNGISKNQAKHVWTGNPLPKGANAVIMLENCKKKNNEIEIFDAVTPGENVSKKGEDIPKGTVAIEAGTRLKPQHLGLLAALGFSKIKVFRKPQIAILASGDELVEVGKSLGEGEIFEVNRLAISALCHELGAETVDLGIAKDSVKEIMGKIKIGLKKADVIITTGGTSVGASDLVPEAIKRLGKPGIIVHGVAMRPAMPTALAVVARKPVIILSGNPVAAMIGFEVFVRPLICRMLWLSREEQRPVVNALVTKKIVSALGRKTFVRVRVFQREGKLYAKPISTRGSGVISTMTRANGYVVVPENREGLEKGESVLVHLFNSIKVEE